MKSLAKLMGYMDLGDIQETSVRLTGGLLHTMYGVQSDIQYQTG